MPRNDILINVLTKGVKQAQSSLKRLTGTVGKLVGVYASWRGLVGAKNFFGSAIKEYHDQEKALIRLTKLVKNQLPKAYKTAVKELTAYAEELQVVGVIADDVTQAGMSQLASFQLQAEAIKILTPAMQDLIVAQYGMNAGQEQAIQAANTLGKAMIGQAGFLARVGISLSETQKQQLKVNQGLDKANTLAEILRDNFGGLNTELRKSSAGAMVAFRNSWGDLKEELGRSMLQFGGVQTTIEKLVAYFGSDAAKSSIQKFGKFIGDVLRVPESIAKDTTIGAIRDFERVKDIMKRRHALIQEYKKGEADPERMAKLPKLIGLAGKEAQQMAESPGVKELYDKEYAEYRKKKAQEEAAKPKPKPELGPGGVSPIGRMTLRERYRWEQQQKRESFIDWGVRSMQEREQRKRRDSVPDFMKWQSPFGTEGYTGGAGSQYGKFNAEINTKIEQANKKTESNLLSMADTFISKITGIGDIYKTIEARVDFLEIMR